MSITDPLADMFTVIRNAGNAKKDKAEFPSSKLKIEILNALKKEGYIKNYKYISDKKQGRVRVYLRFRKEKRPAITNLKRISKPGLRIYVSKDEIPRVLGGMGTAIISTPSGILTDRQARNQGIGGEVICYVW
ncbi:MAG: 30S ribosomal protein S8 [Candidatus Omnitrophica bacterium]|nr:30S ribosomal protein S8 [Candidatus Omnitrophota bacterium]MBU4141126.1 30S ribosomal protein S8 [Candidatus Omnitrophota bacterium]